ncbi:hypothetical protein [Streptomyces deccanensis]|uniref:hypothetical protein n=1 Tax=Streptomyces deccanensis TaxID=424188 RepID=UPI001EFB2ED4|nr:hypothetical protein [Streptomyces deccanensis]ULR52760.1 hypothetical protein L3078_27730 [Streptomyces deccanensis]
MATPSPFDNKSPEPIEISPVVTMELDKILGYMAWLVSAAAVAGLLFIGIRMAIAVRSGGRDEYLREFLLVMSACVLGATAGPVVTFLLN